MIEERERKRGKVVLLVIAALALVGYAAWTMMQDSGSKKAVGVNSDEKKSAYYMSGNSLEKFDLSFLKLENEQKNKIYSPLSIKYALAMLAEGSNGETKSQITDIIGKYQSNKYVNSRNMSFANAMFVRDTFKNGVLPSYTENLTNKYNAEVVYDSFKNATTINKWVNKKTFKLINNLVDDEKLKQANFALVNALAIDMNWNNKIQASTTGVVPYQTYDVKYAHERYDANVPIIGMDGDYSSVKFDNNKMKAKTVEIGASINNYDILKEVGEESIRKTVGAAYKKWLAEDGKDFEGAEKNVDKFLDGYIEEINSNYGRAEGSTDFYLYDDTSVKVFAKDLKKYNGTTLQYVGIMPKSVSLDNYIKDLETENVNKIISNLKEIKADNFKEGVVTKVIGKIPLFEFDYELKLIDDLKTLGITNVFDKNKADLSALTSEKNVYIKEAAHKANIEFSNEGIKAAAATAVVGGGDISAGFEYLYDVPVETIDLTFDKPYMFLIRDKSTGEVWFSGTVYKPLKK